MLEINDQKRGSGKTTKAIKMLREDKNAVAKVKADTDLYTAQKTAEANKKLAESITDELVKYKEAEAHMKHGWVTVNGTGSTIVDNK